MSGEGLGMVVLVLLMAGCGATLEGYVTEAGTEKPLQGATVEVGPEVAVTDARGFYRVEAERSEAPVEVVVSAPAHRRSSRAIALEEDRRLDVALELKEVVAARRRAARDGSGQVEGEPEGSEGSSVPASAPRED